MGRVKRYKKFKACDPFSKQFNRREIDNVHDEPPNIFDDKLERIEKKAKRLENNEMYQMRKFVHLTDKTATSSVSSIKEEIKKIEGKREDESMKTFKKRLRQETRETLRDEIKGLTSTAQKKKLRLKERKQQRKAKPEHLDSNGKRSREDQDDDATLDREFGASETGMLRASDMDDAKMTFDATDADEVKFGERVEAPPDLRFTFKMAGAKKIGLGKGELSAQRMKSFLVNLISLMQQIILYKHMHACGTYFIDAHFWYLTSHIQVTRLYNSVYNFVDSHCDASRVG